MILLVHHWRSLLRVLAVVLIGTGGFSGYWWLYKLSPWRKTLDPAWCASHSQCEYWREVQRGIHRGMWSHDDGFTVGVYGNKYWAKWIMDHVGPATGMDCLGSDLYHSATSMRYITNQDSGENADAWLDWWKENKSKSQKEWLREGFRLRGFDVEVPPTEKNVPVLLTLIGSSDTQEANSLPNYMKYNAFRCLRDTSFDPVVFALNNRTISEDIQNGLIEYAKMYRRWPSALGLGILPFEQKADSRKTMKIPDILEPRFQIIANTLVFGPSLLGVALWIASCVLVGGGCARNKKSGKSEATP